MLQRLTGMALVVAGLVLALADVGLYGAVAFITSQRTREIAIRVAIGAPRAAVLRMLLGRGDVVRSAALAGLALTGVAFRFMSGMIFASWTLDPLRRRRCPRHVRRRHARRMLCPGTPGIAHRYDAGAEGRVDRDPLVRGPRSRNQHPRRHGLRRRSRQTSVLSLRT